MSWLMCFLALTLNIYTEAGGEGKKGMEMVADTVVTRTQTKGYPNTVSGVVLQPGQFSWTSRLHSRTERGLVAYNKALISSRRLRSKKEGETYHLAMKIAYKSLQKGYKPHYRYTHFYSGEVKPKWVGNHKVFKYKNHYFVRM